MKNRLGKNVENIKFLRDGIVQLPRSLQNSTLDLSGNWLGKNMENMKGLGEVMMKLSRKNLKRLSLNF